MIAKRVIFEGRVQGVGFRYTVKDLARGFDVRGWVENLPDGSVELQVTGDKEDVQEFIREILLESPVAHHILHHRSEDIPEMKGCAGFSIKR
jgi:acylphosphatase